MKSTFQRTLSRLFINPLSTMSASVLFITASSRTAYAIITAVDLLWVYGLSVPILSAITAFYKKPKTNIVAIFVSALAGSVFILFLSLLSPFLAMETTLFTILVPVLFVVTEMSVQPQENSPDENLPMAASESVLVGILIIAIAFIREPLGFATLSLPGGQRGIIELFNSAGTYPFPVELMSGSAGALFLLAYILIILRFLEGKNE